MQIFNFQIILIINRGLIMINDKFEYENFEEWKITLKAILNYIIENPKDTEIPDKLLINHFIASIQLQMTIK